LVLSELHNLAWGDAKRFALEAEAKRQALAIRFQVRGCGGSAARHAGQSEGVILSILRL
jgi:hypothetical protein